MQSKYSEMFESPPDELLYTPISRLGRTLLLLGARIDTEYDHARLEIRDCYEPIRVSTNSRYFYGIKLQPSSRFKDIVDRIISVPTGRDNSIDMYRNRLQLYGLTCEDCWGHFDRNIFPLDASNIETLAINRPYMMKEQHLVVTDNNQMPWFSQYAQLKLYILSS
jgi:hypothetical protein